MEIKENTLPKLLRRVANQYPNIPAQYSKNKEGKFQEILYKELYEIAKKNCKNSILIENSEEIDVEEIKKYEKIGIMAGASTPKKSIEAVVEMLNELC